MPSRTAFTARLGAAAVVAGLAAATVVGCGNDVPANAVAKVGDGVITKADFDKWLKTAASGTQQEGGGAAVVPDPPKFDKCVAAGRSQPVPKGTPKPSAASLKKQCRQQYDQLKNDVMQFLIQALWVQQEADARGVKVTDAEVKRSFEDQKKQAFKTDKEYKKFLENSAMSEEDILFRVKLDTLQTKLTQKVTEDEKKISNQDVEEYYEKNKKRFAQPERRDLRVVLTKTKAKADQAKKELGSDGKNFKAVAKKYSIDEASKDQGGSLPDVAKGQQEKALDDAVFAAKQGEIVGPVKTQFGYYVFEVTKIKKASQQSLEQARETIRNLLRSQREQKALDEFIKDFREDYKDKTTCAEDFKVTECKNGPEEKQDTGAVPGGGQQGPAPQGGQAPQQVPQTPQQAPQGAAPAPQGGAAPPPQGGAAPTPAPQGPASP